MTNRSALMMALMTSFTWGLTGIFVRLLPGVSPLAITAIRMAIALLCILPVVACGNAGITRGLTSALRRPTAYVLASFMVGYYLLATSAFQRAPVAEVGLLISTQPLFVLAIRSLGCLPVFRSANCERPSLRETGGALLAIGGMAIILGPGMSASGSLTERHLIGSMMALGAAALSAAYAWLYRRLAEQGKAPDTNAVSLLTFAAGSVILLAAMVLVAMPSSLPAPSWENVALLLGLGVVSTAIPTVGFSLVSRRLPAIVTATISLLVPVFGGLSAFLVLGERLSPNFLVGCVPVLGGVAMIVRRRRG